MKKPEQKHVHLDNETADKVLQQVFLSCRQDPNTIPFEVLKKTDTKNRTWRRIFQWACIVVLIVFLLAPYFFIKPKITETSLTTNANDGTMCYHFIIRGYLPVYEVTARLNGRDVPVEHYGDGNAYQIPLDEDGTLTVTAVLYNSRSTVKTAEIEKEDKAAPELIAYDFREDGVRITVSDTGKGIRYEGVYGLLPDKTKVLPISCDRETSTVVFPYPEDTMNIYIPDRAGNTLQIVLNPRGRF